MKNFFITYTKISKGRAPLILGVSFNAQMGGYLFLNLSDDRELGSRRLPSD